MFAVGMALGASVAALAFDLIFLKVDVPAVGGYAWYLTTAAFFGAAGYGSAFFTRAERGLAKGALAGAALVYGAAGVKFGLVFDGVDLASATFLGAQGLGVALASGFGGIRRGFAARASEAPSFSSPAGTSV